MSIMTDILSTLKEPRIVTHMMYATNLSYGQLKKYLALLTKIGLIDEVRSKENQRLFRITEKGIIFINSITNDGNPIDRFTEVL